MVSCQVTPFGPAISVRPTLVDAGPERFTRHITDAGPAYGLVQEVCHDQGARRLWQPARRDTGDR
jgi:hypothetical protein